MNVAALHHCWCFPNKFPIFSQSSNLSTSTDKCKPPYLTSTLWSIRCEGNRKGRSRKTTFSNDDNDSSNSSNQEEIIALFKRIHTSIAKDGGSATARKRRTHNQKEINAAESVLDVLRQSTEHLMKEEKNVLPKRSVVPKTKRKTEDNSPAPDVNLTRPPSNFVKKSPIPRTSIMKEEAVEVTSEESRDTVELHKIEEMKVSELRELAKSRGIKGYSKLKKGELVKLLKG